MLNKKYRTTLGYCKWCRFKHFGKSDLEIRVTKHCKKMIDRALSRQRIKSNCHHCGHPRKEHDSERQTKNEMTGQYEPMLDTCCGHIKKGVRGDIGFDCDDYCDCEVFL